MKKLFLLIMMTIITIIIMSTIFIKKCACAILSPLNKQSELNNAPVITIQ